MILFLALSLFYLAVPGVASDYVAHPYKNEVNRPLPQNTQLVEGVYSETEPARTVQALPCLRHSQSGATQVDTNLNQNDNSAQNKESPYGNKQSSQAKNLKAPSNYENKFNNKHGYPSDAGSGYATGSNSGNQYSNHPSSGLKDFAGTGSTQGKKNQHNVVNTLNKPDPADADNFARDSNDANAANLAQAVNAANAANQLKKLRLGSESSSSHLNNPANNLNSVNSFNAGNAPYQYQSQIKEPVAAQLRSANHLKNTQSLNEGNDFGDEVQQYNSLVANSRYDSSRRTNKRQDSASKNEKTEDCQQSDKSSTSNDEDLDTRREQELYRFINDKLSEDYEQRNRRNHEKKNENKADNPERTNSENLEQIDSPYHDEYEAYGPPSEKSKSVKNKAVNPFENKQTEDEDDVDKLPYNKKNRGTKSSKKQGQKVKHDQVNKYEYEDDEVQSNAESENQKKTKTSQPVNNQFGKYSQLSKPNKDSQYELAPQKKTNSNQVQINKNSEAGSNVDNRKDKEYSDENQSEEDYIEDYKDDFSEPQSRRGYNQRKAENSLQADCDSSEVEHQQNRRQNNENSDVEEVDVTARSGRRQKVLVGEHTRVCYACSSASNPTCLNPNKQTTVKYCQKGRDSCITKIFKANGIDILTRDCGTSCNDNLIPGLTPKYKKCSVCHSDLCNGAFSLNSQNIFFICTLAVVSITKYYL